MMAKFVGFLRGGCSRGGTLRIPREDWGTLGKIREPPPLGTPLNNPIINYAEISAKTSGKKHAIFSGLNLEPRFDPQTNGNWAFQPEKHILHQEKKHVFLFSPTMDPSTS